MFIKNQTLMLTQEEFEALKKDPKVENIINNEEVKKGWFTIEYADGTATDAEIVYCDYCKEPVKQGRWKTMPHGEAICSKCFGQGKHHQG
jgi:hypothetical protein